MMPTLALVASAILAMQPTFAQPAEDGAAEKKSMEQALCATEAVKKLSREWKGQEIVFSSFKSNIDGHWAWVEAAPETKDGKQHFEGMEGVMHKVGGKWRLATWVSDKVATASDPKAAFKSWSEQFVKEHPGCTIKIFPAK
jgi:hypothetical protein